MVILLAACVVILAAGWRYYRTPLLERSASQEHRLFSGGGRIGLTVGFAALVLFLTNVAYLVRKLATSWHFLGSLRGWLRLHVASGLLGAAMVALHSAFLARSELAQVCIQALAVVLVTGAVGYWLVRLLPRTAAGELKTPAELEDELMAFVDEIRSAVLYDPEAVRLLQELVDDAAVKAPAALRGTLRDLRRARARVEYLARAASHSPTVDWRAVRPVLRRMRRLTRQAVVLRHAGRLIDTWRGLHRVVSIIFVLTVLLHVVWAFQRGF